MFVVGDVHGHRERLEALLRGAGLVDAGGAWTGGGVEPWLIGDLFDRGPDGVGACELAMRLERGAEAASGRARCLLGNHDFLLLSAHVFGGPFRASWLRNGGVERDLARLEPRHVEWLCALPAIARMGDVLLAHADACFYERYGGSVEAVNAAIGLVLRGRDRDDWDRLLDEVSERHAFDGPGGAAPAARFLSRYGGRLLVHGHTPITKVTGHPPEEVRSAHVYAAGLCANVDGGIYLGGPGFVHEASDRSRVTEEQ